MHRLFVPPADLPEITGSDAHYVRDVLRAKIGDRLELFDGTGKIYEAKIEQLGRDSISCQIVSTRQQQSEPKVRITLAQSLPKGHKMDFVVEKAVELGAYNILPMLSERSIAKEAKLARWRRLAKEAAEQSGRAEVPEISELFNFDAVIDKRKDYDLALMPWELEKEKNLKDVLAGYKPGQLSTILVLIGPEGGFSQEEAAAAKKAGFTTISLGNRILRTETAALSALAGLNFFFGD